MSTNVSITPQELVRLIVATDGNLAVVSERLQLQGVNLSEHEIITRVSNMDNVSLGEVLRTGAIMMLYSTYAKTTKELNKRMGVIPASDLARVHAQQAQALANLTSRPTEDAVEQPVSIEAARQRLFEKLDQHEERERQAKGS